MSEVGYVKSDIFVQNRVGAFMVIVGLANLALAALVWF